MQTENILWNIKHSLLAYKQKHAQCTTLNTDRDKQFDTL